MWRAQGNTGGGGRQRSARTDPSGIASGRSAGGLDANVSLDAHVAAEADVAADRETLARDERRRTPREALLEAFDVGVELGVEIDDHRRQRAPARGEEPRVGTERVDVRPEREQVVRGLDRREAFARDVQRTRSLEDRECGAHGRLELEAARRRCVVGIDALLVAEQRKGKQVVPVPEAHVEYPQVEPEVVRVEEAIPRDVLEVGGLVRGALGRLPERELTATQARQVPALAVRLGAVGHLEGEGNGVRRDPAEDLGREHGAEVVRVGDEGVAVASCEERIEQPGGPERDVEIAVARRAPFEAAVLRPRNGAEGLRVEPRHPALHEPEGNVGGDPVVLLQRSEGVVAGPEAVHQHQREPAMAGPSQMEDLSRDEIEERHAWAHGEQRLGAGHPHARSEAAVELDDHRPVEPALAFLAELGEAPGIGERRHRLDVRAREQTGLAAAHRLEAAAEAVDGEHREAGRPHLRFDRREVVGHRSSVTACQRAD